MSRPRQKKEDHAVEIVEGLTFIHEKVKAELAELEAERAEYRKKIATLRAAELAAPRKRAIYFRLARLMLDGVGSDIVASHLARLKPEVLHKIAKALKATEKDVDRAGLKVVKSFLAALRLRGKKLKLEDVEDQYRKVYPRHRVPQRRSLSRTLRRKELWNFKRGRPPEKGDKSA